MIVFSFGRHFRPEKALVCYAGQIWEGVKGNGEAGRVNKEAAASETTEMSYLWDRVLAWQGKEMLFAWHLVVLSILAQ